MSASCEILNQAVYLARKSGYLPNHLTLECPFADKCESCVCDITEVQQIRGSEIKGQPAQPFDPKTSFIKRLGQTSIQNPTTSEVQTSYPDLRIS